MDNLLKSSDEFALIQSDLADTDFATFAVKIVSVTEQLLANGRVDRLVAEDGLIRLRADLILRGANVTDVEPITQLLASLQK